MTNHVQQEREPDKSIPTIRFQIVLLDVRREKENAATLETGDTGVDVDDDENECENEEIETNAG